MQKTLGTACVVAMILATYANGQSNVRGYVPRHERVAASVLRKRTASARQPGKKVAAKPTPVAPQTLPAPQIAQPLSDVMPPAPPESILTSEVSTQSVVTGSELVSEGEVIVEDTGAGDMFVAAPPQTGCQSCGQCSTGCGYCWIDTFGLNVGVTGMKNAINNGHSGSFGFQEGINWGSPWVFTPLGMNTQLGFRAIQSEFNGTQFDGGNANNDHRSQFFVTAGFFKRVDCGWQGGVVFDYLKDEWISDVDLGQVRAELSWAAPNGSSLGFWLTNSVMEDTGRVLSSSSQLVDLETHDLYAVFYRVQSNKHRLGQWRVFAGFTGDSDGLIGSDFKLPLAGTWSLEPNFTYLVPDESTSLGGPAEEGWNVAVNLVWYPGRAVRGINYCQLPLFDVADNGSMISRRIRQ